ncbi:hypothetical protein Kfla_1374 [Kribbella flavida DSM 17836]|uniref:Uncharacterized protein n=1 Tax=Kribbella flavida (strain DSM 17836 / JCM 10339 / NBRC 14399) TaxID=479435 RepID=D2PKG4_KRIFD|nr:hypothetical protein [Kribbella flavida]ADB30476.1 hypothetical protein Kfla_1374 [Kribbella flavida DSM 17836]
MNLPGKRVLLGSAIAVAALGAGGFAYAAGNDPVPEQGYVTIEDGATTPSPAPEGQSAQRDGRDCPEKNGGSGTEQGQGQTQPEQNQADPQGNA